jgi:pyrroloquinoline quinone biosynthesis protein D
MSGPAASLSRPRLARKVRLKYDPIEKQFIVLYPERGITLNGSATEILQRCDGERTVETIAAELAAASGAPLSRVEREVAAFVEEMRKRGVVELV